jgi:HAMP domain-containing protein
LVAEFNIRNLTSILRRLDGRARLVDADLRTVLDTGGYLAFQALAAGALGEAVRGALDKGPRAGVADVRGVRSLVSSASIAAPGSTVDPHWAVIADRPVKDLSLPANERRRGAWMVAVSGICLALLLPGWLYFVVLRPLRSLADVADRLADGDLETIIAPARNDEIGAIGVCLDICRQARVYGTDRLAGAVRLRGAGSDLTMVLPLVATEQKVNDVTTRGY